MSIAQCEFWSDTLDRWAEDLVDPARQRHVQRQVQEQPAAGPGARSASDPGRRSQSARGDAGCRAGPAGARGRRSTSCRPIKLSGTQKGLDDRVDKLGDDDSRAARRRERVRLRDRPAGQGLGGHAGGHARSWPSRRPAAGHRAPRPRPSSCCCNPSGSIPRAAAAAARRPAAADTARRSTRRWPSSAAASTRRKSGKTAASLRRPANRGRRCPKSSAPASTSISTGSNELPAGSEKRRFPLAAAHSATGLPRHLDLMLLFLGPGEDRTAEGIQL